MLPYCLTCRIVYLADQLHFMLLLKQYSLFRHFRFVSQLFRVAEIYGSWGRCSNLEETPRAGGHSSSVFDGKRCVLDAFKKGRLGDGGGGNVASGVRTPSSSSSLQVSGGDVETPSPRVPSTPADSPAARGGGGSTNRVTFSTLFRGTWGSLMPKHPAAAGAAAGDFAGSAVAGGGSKGGSPRGELAFRIWSLPNEGAITTDPYTRVGGTIERNESKPPSRPS